jgi:hypothetical protein
MGVDLTKNFYFSYTYNLSATLQSNMSIPRQPQNVTSPGLSTPFTHTAGDGTATHVLLGEGEQVMMTSSFGCNRYEEADETSDDEC